MSDAQMQQFGHRLSRIDERHRKLASGVQISVRKDGLIVARPARAQARFPWRGLLMILVAAMAFKGLLHAQIGAETYAERVAALSNGTIVEQAGAWFMAPDPVTIAISAVFQGLSF